MPDLSRRCFIALAQTGLLRVDPRLDQFGRDLDQLRNKQKIPGLSAAVLREQRVTWAKGFGWQDRERQIAATSDTPYRIASLTKTFSSTLLMQLFEQGKLNLEAPIRDFVPITTRLYHEIKDNDVRIRHVFSHTSEGWPGENYRYNGSRFVALTYVIEQLSGKSFRDLLAANILDKLAMTRSVPGQDAEAARYQSVLEQLAKPYRLDGDRIVPAEYPPKRINASAGLISTVADLAKFDAALDRHDLIRAETQEKAWTPAGNTSGKTLPYGLGWFIQRHKRTRLVWHYGYWPGSFSALYLKIPEKRTTLFLLANSDGLSRPYALGDGDVTASEFARLFLAMNGL